MDKIQLARTIAEAIHCNQKYDDQDYFFHLEQVASVLTLFGMNDDKYIISAFLHDAVEDCNLKLSYIYKHFGCEVTGIVYSVTNEIGNNRKEKNTKTYLKLRQNQDAIIVKLADRIANIEHAIIKDNKSFVKMYKKEYEAFKYALQMEGHAIKMWAYLDRLMSCSSLATPKCKFELTRCFYWLFYGTKPDYWAAGGYVHYPGNSTYVEKYGATKEEAFNRLMDYISVNNLEIA